MNKRKDNSNNSSRKSQNAKTRKNNGNQRHITIPQYPHPEPDKQHEIGKGESKPKGDEVHGQRNHDKKNT